MLEQQVTDNEEQVVQEENVVEQNVTEDQSSFSASEPSEPLVFEDEQEAFERMSKEELDLELPTRSKEDKDTARAAIAVAISDTSVLTEDDVFSEYSDYELQFIERERTIRNLVVEKQLMDIAAVENLDMANKAMFASQVIENDRALKKLEDMTPTQLEVILENQIELEHFERKLEEADNLESAFARMKALEGLEGAYAQRATMLQIVSGINKEFGGFGWSDLGAHFVPFYSSQAYVSLARDVFKMEDWFGDDGLLPALGASLAMDEMQARFKDASFDEKLEILSRFAEWAESGSGLWMGSGNNRLAVSAAASGIFEKALQGEDTSVLEKRLNDISNALDLVPIIGGLKAVYGVPYKVSKLSEEAQQSAIMAGKTSPESADALKVDVDAANANETIPMPGINPVVLNKEQQAVVDYAELIKTEGLTATQRAQIQEKIEELTRVSATAMETRLMKYNHGKTQFNQKEGSLEIIEHYDTGVAVGNQQSTDLLKAVLNEKFGANNYQLVDEKGYFVVKRTDELSFSSEVQNLADFGLASNSFIDGLLSGSRFQTPEAKFGADILRSLSAGRQSKELAARATENLEALKNLSFSEQREINALFKKYSGVEMPKEELNKLSSQQRQAYTKVRETLDAMYYADNALVRSDRVARGEMTLNIVSKDGLSSSYIGKPLKDVAAAATAKGERGSDGMVDVLDQATGSIKRVNIDDEYAAGRYLFKVDDASELGSKYVLIDRNLFGSNISVAPIPLKVLNYRPNYIPRYYEQTFIVEKINKDGKKIAVGASNSRKEAELLVQTHGGEGVASYRLSREAAGQVDDAINTWGSNVKGVGLGARGEGLTDVSGNIAELDNAVEAITRAARSFGARHGSREFIQNLKNQWLVTYGHLADETKGVKSFPSQASESLKSDKGAKAIFDYINQLEGAKTTADIEFFSNVMHKLADIIEIGRPGAFRTALAKATNQLAMKDPSRGLRTLAFYTLLALNPTRQFFMQAQHSLLSANLVPAAATPAKMYQGMMLQMAARDGISKDAKAFYKKAAGVTGMKPEEFEELLKVYKDLGIQRAISSHYLVDDIVTTFNSSTGGLAGLAKNTMHYGVGAPLNMAKAVGFDAGNYVNSMGAFMASVTKFKKENPGASLNSREARDAIRQDYDKFTWYMGREGTGDYTNGMLGAALQFFTIQHKGLATMLPSTLGGRADMSAMEKSRTAGAIFALYGLDGFGLVNTIDKLQRDMDDEYFSDDLKTFLQQGLFGLAAENFFDEGFDLGTWSPVNMNVVSLLSGLSTTLMQDNALRKIWADSLNSLNYDTAKDFFPSMTAIKRIVDVASSINRITSYDAEAFSTTEKLNASLAEISRISGTLNNVQKTLLMNEFNKQYTSTGNVLIDRQNERSFLAALLGLQSVEEREVYRLAGEVYQSGMTQLNGNPRANEAGGDFYRKVKVDLLKHKDAMEMGSEAFNKAMEQILESHVVRFIDDDSTYKRAFMDSFYNAYMNDAEEDAVTRMIVNTTFKNAQNIPLSEFEKLRNTTDILNSTSKGKYQEIVDMFDILIQRREELSQQLDR